MRVLAGATTYPNAQRTTPPPDRFTPVNGHVQTIALQYTSGKRVTSRIPGAPDQMMYTLSDGRRAYLPLEVGASIDELRLAPGQPFTICKYGPREWDVQYADPAPAAAGGPAPAHPPAPPPAPRPAPQPPLNGQGEDVAAIMTRCYASAIEIAAAAAKAAQGRGLMISPSFEDVRCISTALFIQMGGRK